MTLQGQPLWIIVIQDRHKDIEVQPWSDREKALQFAEYWAKNVLLSPNWDEPKVEEVEGYVYFADCSSEGDCIWVVEEKIRPYPITVTYAVTHTA